MIHRKDETGKPAQNPATGVQSPSIPTTSTRDGSGAIRFGGKGNGK